MRNLKTRLKKLLAVFAVVPLLFSCNNSENPYLINKSSPSEIFFPLSKKIYNNHEYSIIAIYNNPLDKSSPDMGMGTIGGLFTPDGSVNDDWAEPDYNNRLYIDDMVMMLGAPHLEGWHELTADEMRNEPGIR